MMKSVSFFFRHLMHSLIRPRNASTELQDQALRQAFNLIGTAIENMLPLDCGWLCLMIYGISWLNALVYIITNSIIILTIDSIECDSFWEQKKNSLEMAKV